MSNRIAGVLNRRLSAALLTKPLAIRLERPIVSFTFDDAPQSAASVGAGLLESVGACGTFYVAGGLCGGDEEGTPILSEADIVRLHQSGHEIACHTYSHRRVSGLSSAGFKSEIDRNQAFFSSLCGDVRLSNFSYPFGDVSPGRKLQVESVFATGRGITPGVNSGWADLGLLKAVSLYAEHRDDRAVDTYLERAGREKGWLIFYTHDVDPDPSPWGATVDQMKSVVEAVRRLGYEVLTVRNAVGRLAR